MNFSPKILYFPCNFVFLQGERADSLNNLIKMLLVAVSRKVMAFRKTSLRLRSSIARLRSWGTRMLRKGWRSWQRGCCRLRQMLSSIISNVGNVSRVSNVGKWDYKSMETIEIARPRMLMAMLMMPNRLLNLDDLMLYSSLQTL